MLKINLTMSEALKVTINLFESYRDAGFSGETIDENEIMELAYMIDTSLDSDRITHDVEDGYIYKTLNFTDGSSYRFMVEPE